ncbi:MAG: hypothetical protein ACRD29_16930 [Acidimicrobiales bacterium]
MTAAGAIAAAVAAAVVFLPTTPVAADHIGCESGNACIWAGTQWQTDGVHERHLHFGLYIPNFNQWRYGSQHAAPACCSAYTAWSNASSMSNNGNFETAFFFTGGANCDGPNFAWLKKTGDKNLADGPAGSNNAFKSAAFASFIDDCR